MCPSVCPPFADLVWRPFQMKAFWAVAELALWRPGPRWALSLPSEHGRDAQRRHVPLVSSAPTTSNKCVHNPNCNSDWTQQANNKMQYLKLTPYMFSVVVVTFCASGCGYVKYEHFSDGAQWPPLIANCKLSWHPSLKPLWADKTLFAHNALLIHPGEKQKKCTRFVGL